MVDAPAGLPPFTIEDQVKAAERELSFRHRVYGRRVAGGQMTQAQAQREIRAMTAIVETLKDVAKGGRLS